MSEEQITGNEATAAKETGSEAYAGNETNQAETRTFTQEDVDRIVQNRLKQVERKFEGVDVDEYKSKLTTLGKLIEYPEGRGWARDIAKDGSLVVETISGEMINLTSPLISEVK